MRIKGITKRWLINSLGLILVVIIALEIGCTFVVRNYYYNSLQQGLTSSSTMLRGLFDTLTYSQESEFQAFARQRVEEFSYREKMELIVFNQSGTIIFTSTGFEPNQDETMPDYAEAVGNGEGKAVWIGYLSSGEHVMALTRMILPDGNGGYDGALRFVVSLEVADRQIFLMIALLLVAGLAIIFFVVMSGAYFINSIVNPVREISVTARRIAQGDFKARIDKQYDDEIGELCDTINYMAGELGAAEGVKNDFISSVSHELRTPLTAIKGWAETMQSTQDPKMLNRGMSIITGEASRLSGIVEELLDFSRMQNGRMTLMMDRTDVLSELSEAVYMFNQRSDREQVEILYDEPEIIPVVLGDKNRLRQVFINVLDNAIKYSDPGGHVYILAEENDSSVVITIRDEGCGIPESDLSRVKEKFFKGNQARRGSGIGLALADEIMRLHSGKLDIDSKEGEGTTVLITLPLLPPNRGETAAIAQQGSDE